MTYLFSNRVPGDVFERHIRLTQLWHHPRNGLEIFYKRIKNRVRDHARSSGTSKGNTAMWMKTVKTKLIENNNSNNNNNFIIPLQHNNRCYMKGN